MKVGQVETTHPKPGSSKHAAAPPPAPEKVRMLPSLADLPAEAEEQARTIAELCRELAQARRDLAAAKRGVPQPPATRTVEKPVLRAG